MSESIFKSQSKNPIEYLIAYTEHNRQCNAFKKKNRACSCGLDRYITLVCEKLDKIKNTNVSHPSHYGGDVVYEVIKVINAWNLGFNTGSAIKYIVRAGKKSVRTHIEDIEKAIFYLQDELKQLKGEGQR